MKAVLTIKKADELKYVAAASWAGVRVLDSVPVGPKVSLRIAFSSVDKVLEMGEYLSSMTPEQVKEELARMAKEAKEKTSPKK